MTSPVRTRIRTTSLIVLSILLVLLVLDTLTMSARAQEEDPGDAFRERREEVRERLELLQNQASRTNDRAASTTEAVRAQMEERRDELTDRLRDRIKNLLENMTRRMQAAINRLTDIALRMETRIEKLEGVGVDGDEAMGHVNAAREALREAQALIDEDFEDTVDEAIGSEAPRTHIAEIRATFAEASRLIREAHRELREALAALKRAVADEGDGGGVSDAVRADASQGGTTTEETE